MEHIKAKQLAQQSQLAQLVKSTTVPNDEVIAAGLSALKNYTQSLHAKLPYYTEDIAAEVRKWIEALHASHKPVKLSPRGMTLNTLKLRYYQGRKYLRDTAAQEDHIHELIRRTRAHMFETYMELHRQHTLQDKQEILVSQDPDTWKDELTDFIEFSPPGRKFHRSNMNLSDGDMDWITEQFAGVEALFGQRISVNEILIVRLEP